MDADEADEEYNDLIDSYWIMGLASVVLAIGVTAGYYSIKNYIFPRPELPQSKCISPSRIEAKAMDLDSTNEGLEQLLTIDGKPYTLQEKMASQYWSSMKRKISI